MTRRSTVLRTGVIGLLALVGMSDAAINAEGNLGVVRTLSARPLRNVKLNVQLGVNYANRADHAGGAVDSIGILSDSITLNGRAVNTYDPNHMLSANLSFGLGLMKYWDAAVSLPFYYDWTSFGESDGGLGDVAASTKISLPPAGKVWFNALVLGVSVPVGLDNGYFPRVPMYEVSPPDTQPAEGLYSYECVALRPMYLMTLDFIDGPAKVPFAMHLNVGANLMTNNSGKHTLIGALALEYTPRPIVTLFVEGWMEQRFSTLSEGRIARDPFFVTPGIKFRTPGGVYFSLAGDFCVSLKNEKDRVNWKRGDGYVYSTPPSQPTWGVQFSFGWSGFLNAQDRDRDGLKDDDDKCPDQAEDIDAFEDSDGCPDYDNDKDGIPDSLDKCPGEPEDFDNFEDKNGCPDPDNDKDGIADDKDKCVLQPEDFDGFEDKDGCPDADNDKDGVPDSLDKCPNDPEDFDNFQDKDGCPDIDNDQDGIPDLKDKCPDLAETFNSLDDGDGCPDTVKKVSSMPRSQVLRGIAFPSGASVLLPQSFTVLDPIADHLKEYTDVQIEVRGHTDASGKQATNMLLSQQRADAVLNYFVSKGIDASRLRAVGYGSSAPIADNRSAAGRTANRRIEIVRLR